MPILQLRRSEVPELPFRPGTDVFQLLWCPNDHAATYSVVCRAFWWPLDLVMEGGTPPLPSVHLDGYVPDSCALHPERVDEYPQLGDLPDPIQERILAWEPDQDEPIYEWQLSSAPGTKVGGYPDWLQNPEWPTCAAGHRMEHLMTVADNEFDGGTYQRWMPIEETDIWEGPWEPRLQIQGPAGLDLGMASIYIFLCRECPAWPIQTVYQR